MSATAGWYPDPGGQAGLFRYWDGRTWSAATSPNPAAPPPAAPLGGQPTQPLGQQPLGQGSSYGQGQQPLGRQAGAGPGGVPPAKKSPVGWFIGAGALLLVIIVVVVLVVRNLGTETVTDPPDPQNPSPTATICSEAGEQTAAPEPQNGDRVTSGKLSYPTLRAPFAPPAWDSRVPFGRDVQNQNAMVEEGPNGTSWVAGVMVARLLAGDGFYGPEQGATVVAECITGKFYGDAEVDRKDTKNEATKIDGHDAWIIEAHLTFDLSSEGIKTKGETMIVVVVDTVQGEGGLFYASVPDTSPQFMQPARDSLKNLKVAS